MKKSHEAKCAQALRIGSGAAVTRGLHAIGPDVVVTGELVHVDAEAWKLRLGHFLIGDLNRIVEFIDKFAVDTPENKYVLSNELGDGRVLNAAPVLVKHVDGYDLLCPVKLGATRIDAQRIGSAPAIHRETNDLYVDDQGGIARVSGVDYLPQRVTEVLSMQRGESPFAPTFGMRFFEYFDAYRGSPWLDLLFKLDVIRQASIPVEDATKQAHTPLQCVTRVRDVALLADTPTNNRLPIRVDFDVQGIGRWTRDLSIYVPTVEQMTQRTRMLAGLQGPRNFT